MTDYWTENNIEKPQQIIVCAANRYPTGEILVGARHWDNLMREQAEARGLGMECSQGFINQFGEFLTRKEAFAIVKSNGQAFDQERNGSDELLFSEGLY